MGKIRKLRQSLIKFSRQLEASSLKASGKPVDLGVQNPTKEAVGFFGFQQAELQHQINGTGNDRNLQAWIIP